MKTGTGAVFSAGFLQGAAFVLIPALGATLRGVPYDLSNTAYGLLYFPEILGAVLAAFGAGAVQRRLGARGLFRLGAFVNAAAMAGLTVAYFATGPLLLAVLLAETLLLGVGFGLTNAAINRAASLLFAGAAVAAVTLLNAVIGGATAVSPVLLHGLSQLGAWNVWPGILLLLWLVLPWLPLAAEGDAERRERGGLGAWRRSMLPFALGVLIYAVCEGSFGSWADVLMTVDRHLPAASGALALSLFWGGMTLARFVLGALPNDWLPRRLTFLLSPVGMAACFLVIPQLASATALVLAFTLAGVSCGIYYPYSMSYGIAAHPEEGTQMAGLLVGALMVGEGLGSSGLGPLQSWLPLDQIYRLSALWALPLVYFAWRNSRPTRP